MPCSHGDTRAWPTVRSPLYPIISCAPILPFGCSCRTRRGQRQFDRSCDFAESSPGENPLLTMFWPTACDDATLPVRASAAVSNGPDTLDLLHLPVESAIWRESPGHEYVIIADGWRRVRLDVRGTSLASGPVYLRYDLAGFRRLRASLVSLGRLEALKRVGRLPRTLFARDSIASRWASALAACDMRAAGASQTDIAIALFGARKIHADSVDRIRKRIARLLQLADRRIEVGYQRFFAG